MDGTDIFAAEEIIAANNFSAEGTATTKLKNLQFVDREWLANHPGGKSDNIAGNATYTVNGTTYYYVGELDGNGNGHYTDDEHSSNYATMISVTAYSADGTPLAAASWTQDNNKSNSQESSQSSVSTDTSLTNSSTSAPSTATPSTTTEAGGGSGTSASMETDPSNSPSSTDASTTVTDPPITENGNDGQQSSNTGNN